MEDMKSLLTVTLVVMAAGSSIYTIKTFMKPGMDLNINLEENHGQTGNGLWHLHTLSPHSHALAEALVALNQTLPVRIEIPGATEIPFGDVENNTIAELLLPPNKSDLKETELKNLQAKPFTDRRRSLLVRDEAKLNEIVEKIRKFDKKSVNKTAEVNSTLSKVESLKRAVKLASLELSGSEVKNETTTQKSKKSIEPEVKDKKAKKAEVGEIKKEVESEPLAGTMLGKIQGKQLGVLGRKVNAFLGVPYAQAPVGSLRFARPLPVTSWNGTLNATKFGPACVQHLDKNSTSGLKISEDCLSLNVWTPAKRVPGAELPVIFFIHGGNFVSGSNSADESDGRVLAALQNVIVVSPNYRLGPLGFFSVDGHREKFGANKSSTTTTTTPSVNKFSAENSSEESGKESSESAEESDSSTESSKESAEASPQIARRDGNFGLWDLVEALKWTRANIGAFGGSPDSVTLVGQSSGALAASLLLLSPETTHLANRAILQSGSPTVFNFYYQQSQRSSEEFATLLGCMKATEQLTQANFQQISKCVHGRSEDEILRATDKQLTQKLYAYSPRIGDELLPSMPQDLLEKLKEAGNKQILIGSNAHDVPFFFSMGYPHLFTKKTPTLKDLEEVRQFLAASLKDWGISRRTLRLINSFFLERSSTLEPRMLMKAMHDIFGDLTFSCPSLFFADRFAALNSTSGSAGPRAYFYQFNRSERDESVFVFGHPLRYANDYSGTDIDFSKRIMQFWANFARSGNPGAIDGTSGDWAPYTPDRQAFLQFGPEVRLGQHPGASMVLQNSTRPTGSAAIGAVHKLNCDTWKHAFKIFN